MQLVLVISKDPEIQKYVIAALDASWSRVWSCQNPKDAITMVGQQEPSVIVLDGRSDLASSLDVMKRLKKGLHFDYISCLLFGSAQEKMDLAALSEFGIDDTLPWPSAVPIIAHKIKLLVDKYESKKARKGHFLEVESQPESGFLKSDSQYDDVPQSSDPFRMSRKSIFVVDSDPKAGDAQHQFEKPKGIDLPDDFFEDNPDVELEKPSIQGGAVREPDELVMNTLGRPVHAETAHTNAPDLSVALDYLTPERLDEIAAQILDKKLSNAAKENIRKLISRSVREELNKLMPEIVSYVKKNLS